MCSERASMSLAFITRKRQEISFVLITSSFFSLSLSLCWSWERKRRKVEWERNRFLYAIKAENLFDILPILVPFCCSFFSSSSTLLFFYSCYVSMLLSRYFGEAFVCIRNTGHTVKNRSVHRNRHYFKLNIFGVRFILFSSLTHSNTLFELSIFLVLIFFLYFLWSQNTICSVHSI